MNYFKNKEQNKINAVKHIKEMNSKYSQEIRNSVRDSIVFGHGLTTDTIYILERENKKREICDSKIITIKTDSVSAVCEFAKDARSRVAVLNFASYKNPGGMFLNGSIAQEEALCHESILYNVLSDKTFAPYYKKNCETKNRALYENAAIYSPNIVFERNGIVVECDVLTCAAPNKTAAQKYCNVSDNENAQVLKDRIRYIIKIAESQNVDTFIVGAWGCGVFGQDPTEVATLFKEAIDESNIPKFVFAIIDEKTKAKFSKALS